MKHLIRSNNINSLFLINPILSKVPKQAINEIADMKRRRIIAYNPHLKELARQLRNNSTKSEIRLWKCLKGKYKGKYDFHRQKPLDNFIADFFCYELKLVIEIDGITHEWEENRKRDLRKDRMMNELDLNVLRFPDSMILEDLDATLAVIEAYIDHFENGRLIDLLSKSRFLNPYTGKVIEGGS